MIKNHLNLQIELFETWIRSFTGCIYFNSKCKVRGLRNNLNIAERKMKSPVKMDIKTKVSGPWGHPWFRSWS